MAPSPEKFMREKSKTNYLIKRILCALAVVAGNQLGPARGPRVGLLFSFWVAARIAFLVAPASIASVLLNASFAGLLGAQVAPRLFGAAKKLRNLALPAVLTRLAIQIEKMVKLKSQVKKAMMYPAVVVVVAVMMGNYSGRGGVWCLGDVKGSGVRSQGSGIRDQAAG